MSDVSNARLQFTNLISLESVEPARKWVRYADILVTQLSNIRRWMLVPTCKDRSWWSARYKW